MKQLKIAPVAVFAVLYFCPTVSAEIGSIKGTVSDNGAPIKGATVKFLLNGYSGVSPGSETVIGVLVTRHFAFGAGISFPLNAPGMYSVKPDKKGRYAHYGLPVGIYTMWIESGGAIVEQVSGVAVKPGKLSTQQDFDISKDRTIARLQ